MKTSLFICTLVFLCSLWDGCRSSRKEEWQLVWEDSFSREGFIDTATWSKIPRGLSDWNNYMSSFDSCYAVENGNLILHGIKNITQTQDTAPLDPDGYNIYGVELYPDSLVFSVNRQRIFAYPQIETDQPGQYPFDRPFYLLIDMQLGGNWVGKVNPEDLPVKMEIDWVRFYKKQ